MFVRSPVPGRARARRAHYLSAAGLFGILGFHVGVWAVQLAPLSAGLGLDPAALGAAATAAGYTAFIISPLTIGLLAQATSLRLALALLIPTSLAIAFLATRWPSTSTPAPAAATIPSRQPARAGRTHGARSQPDSAGNE